MSIKSMPVHERPRERILKGEVSSLSDSELLAVLMRHGSSRQNVFELSRELLRDPGGWRGLLRQSADECLCRSGLGPGKTAVLIAVKEIIRRYLKETAMRENYLKDPQAVIDYLKSDLRDRKIEIYKVLFLNKANAIVADENISFGTVDQAPVYVREVIAKSLKYGATALIMVHNHPSGRVEPSNEDRMITDKVKKACSIMSLDLLDHIIIGGNGYFSFREHGYI